MSMLNKKGDVFTLLGIQEDKEREQQGECGEYCGCLFFLERKRGGKGGMVPHYQHTEDCSVIEGLQNMW